MSTPAFTPGEWIKDGQGTPGHVKAIINDGDRTTPTVCKFAPFVGAAPSITREEADANGHLIAASPELYSLLREARSEIMLAAGKEGVVVEPTLLSRIDAALAKARGEVQS